MKQWKVCVCVKVETASVDAPDGHEAAHAAMAKIEKEMAEKGYKVDRIWWEYFREEVPE